MKGEQVLLVTLKLLDAAIVLGTLWPSLSERVRLTARTIREHREAGTEIPDSVIDELLDLDRDISEKMAARQPTGS